jgi:hypothetical protein
MTLVISVFVPEGIVMASDSRQSISLGLKGQDGKDITIETTNSDSAIKTHLLETQGVGISNFGQALLNGVPMSSHVRRFIDEVLVAADDIETIPAKLKDYFSRKFPAADVGFHVAGYSRTGRVSVPHVYFCHVTQGLVQRKNVKPDGAIAYGATWSGQIDVMSSIVNPLIGKDEKGQDKVIHAPAPIIWDAMTTQDAIDFAIYAIRTTIDTMRFQARPKNVGGPIDVLLLTPESKPRWILRKELSC